MYESFPSGAAMDVVVYDAMERFVKLAVGSSRNERPALSAKVRPGNVSHLDQVAEHFYEDIDVAKSYRALAFENGTHVIAPCESRDVPFRNVADAFGRFQKWRRHKGNVAESCARYDEKGAQIRSLLEPFDSLSIIRYVLFAKRTELFKVVGRVKLVFDDRFLADYRVKKVTALWHVTAGAGARIAFGVNVPATVRGRGDVEIARHKTRCSVEQSERFPIARFSSEKGLASEHSYHVNPKGSAQGVIDLTEHLVWLDDFDPEFGVAEDSLAEPVHD
jgi:hypothetical protein